MMGQLLSALKYLHEEAELLHRDLKPQNILVQPGPLLKLTDFGLSRDLSASSVAHTMAGTAQFIAPEVNNFEPYGTPADIFSLGIQ